VRSTEELLE